MRADYAPTYRVAIIGGRRAAVPVTKSRKVYESVRNVLCMLIATAAEAAIALVDFFSQERTAILKIAGTYAMAAIVVGACCFILGFTIYGPYWHSLGVHG